MQVRSRRAVLQVEALEDRTVPTLLPNPLLDGSHPEFAHLASAVDCGEDPSITGRCAPELPEWLLSLLHVYAQTAVDVVLPLAWGQEARDIYRAFLDGPFDQRGYADGHEVVEGNVQAVGFRASTVTRHVTEGLLDALRTALVDSFTVPPPKGIDCGSLPADEEVAIPVRRSGDEGLLTSRQLRDFELSLEYAAIQEIPGIFAGGISDSMGVGMDDRAIDGYLRVTRRTLDGQTVALDLRTDLTFWVYDSIDFCPGALGDWLAQFLTRPLQLLQANGWAQAVPFTVTFTPESLGITLQGDELPAACGSPEPVAGPPTPGDGMDVVAILVRIPTMPPPQPLRGFVLPPSGSLRRDPPDGGTTNPQNGLTESTSAVRTIFRNSCKDPLASFLNSCYSTPRVVALGEAAL
jgi:hypothetical protein